MAIIAIVVKKQTNKENYLTVLYIGLVRKSGLQGTSAANYLSSSFLVGLELLRALWVA